MAYSVTNPQDHVNNILRDQKLHAQLLRRDRFRRHPDASTEFSDRLPGNLHNDHLIKLESESQDKEAVFVVRQALQNAQEDPYEVRPMGMQQSVAYLFCLKIYC